MRGESEKVDKADENVAKTVSYEFKVIIVGDPKAGKSSLVQSYCQGIFNKTYKATVGVEYAERLVEVEGKLIKLALWDISGQEMLLKISDKYIKEADGLIFVYDVSEESSFNSFSIWMRYISQHLGGNNSLLKLPKAVAGNKIDLRHKQVVAHSRAKEVAIPDGVDADHVIEVSARSGKNLNLLFYLLTNQMYRLLANGGIRRIGRTSIPVEGQAVFDEEIYKHSIDGSPSSRDGSEYSHVFKILLLGAPRVGKTSLRFRFCRDYYSSEYFATAGFEYGTRTVAIDNVRVRIQVWDVAGDDVYDSTRRGYYKGANAFLIVYDVGNKSSFARAENLLKELDLYGHSEAPKILVGNKSDIGGKRKVSFCAAEDFAAGWRVPLLESSAQTGHQVDAAFMKLAIALKRQLAPWKKIYDFS